MSENLAIIPAFDVTSGSDKAILSDTVSLESNKYISDTIITASSGTMYLTPFYTEVTGNTNATYWETGYLEGELTFT